MGFKCGIVGLPNVGKSTLFNALTQTAAAQAANYPFCTIEPNVGDVAVPDPRLEVLAGDRRLQGDHPDAADLRRHRRPGARRLQGRGARQPVSRQHPRVRRHRPCRALFRGRRRHPCRGPDRSALRHRDDRDRIDARRSRQPRAARGPQWRRRPRAATRKPRRLLDLAQRASSNCAKAPGARRRGRAARSEGCSTRSACSPPSRCSMSATSRRPRPTRATRSPRRSRRAAKEEGAAASSSRRRSRARSRCCRATEQKEYLEAVGLDEPGLNRVIRAGYACCIW